MPSLPASCYTLIQKYRLDTLCVPSCTFVQLFKELLNEFDVLFNALGNEFHLWITHRKEISLWKRRYCREKKQFGPFRDTKKEIIIYADRSICSNEKSFCSFLLPRYVRRVRLLLLPVIVEQQQHVKHESVASVGGNHDPYLNHSSHHPTSPLVNRRTARFSYIVNRCMQRGKKKATNSAGLRDKLNS